MFSASPYTEREFHCLASMALSRTWKRFLRCWPFVRGIHWSPMDFSLIGPVTPGLGVSLMLAKISCWTNDQVACDSMHNFMNISLGQDSPSEYWCQMPYETSNFYSINKMHLLRFGPGIKRTYKNLIRNRNWSNCKRYLTRLEQWHRAYASLWCYPKSCWTKGQVACDSIHNFVNISLGQDSPSEYWWVTCHTKQVISILLM